MPDSRLQPAWPASRAAQVLRSPVWTLFATSNPLDQGLLFHRENCSQFQLSLERTGWRINDIFDLRVSLEVDAGVTRDEVELHLQWQSADAFADGTAGVGNLRFVVDDPDALLAEILATGAAGRNVVVRDTEWGTRELGFRDPDGNGLTFYRAR